MIKNQAPGWPRPLDVLEFLDFTDNPVVLAFTALGVILAAILIARSAVPR
jgi:hypothetical protein